MFAVIESGGKQYRVEAGELQVRFAGGAADRPTDGTAER